MIEMGLFHRRHRVEMSGATPQEIEARKQREREERESGKRKAEMESRRIEISRLRLEADESREILKLQKLRAETARAKHRGRGRVLGGLGEVGMFSSQIIGGGGRSQTKAPKGYVIKREPYIKKGKIAYRQKVVARKTAAVEKPARVGGSLDFFGQMGTQKKPAVGLGTRHANKPSIGLGGFTMGGPAISLWGTRKKKRR